MTIEMVTPLKENELEGVLLILFHPSQHSSYHYLHVSCVIDKPCDAMCQVMVCVRTRKAKRKID